MTMQETIDNIRREKATHFPAWKSKVNKILSRKLQADVSILPDFPYFDMMDRGMTPHQAAQHVIDNLDSEI